MNYNSMIDTLGQEFAVGDICLTPSDGGNYSRMSLEPVLITKIDIVSGEYRENDSFKISFVYREDRLEETFTLPRRQIASIFKLDNPEFYLQDSRIASLIQIRQDILNGIAFQVRLPIF